MRAMSDLHASVIGAGLAGSEAAWQLAEKGIRVSLYEMKPEKHSPAHHTDQFAELVCSNSFRGDRLSNAVGLLKEEMRRLDSLVMRWAERTRVPAGDALAVEVFGDAAGGAAGGENVVEEGEVKGVALGDAGGDVSFFLLYQRKCVSLHRYCSIMSVVQYF